MCNEVPEKEGDTHTNEDITANIFPKLKKIIILQIKGVQYISNKINANTITPKNNIAKLLTVNDKEKKLKSSQNKKTIRCRGKKKKKKNNKATFLNSRGKKVKINFYI